MATYAAVLDGRHLWVAVDEQPGTLALREPAGPAGTVLAAEASTGPAQPGQLAAVLALPDTPDRVLEVVLVPPGGARPRPVWTAPLAPARILPGADGRTRAVLDRADDGTLQVRRERLPAARTLLRVATTPDALLLTLDRPGTVALLGPDDHRVATVEPDAEGVVPLTTAAVTGAADQLTRVMGTGPDGAWLPVRRHADDLADPDRAAPLPDLRDPATGLPRLRLRWDAQGLLVARLLDPTEGDT